MTASKRFALTPTYCWGIISCVLLVRLLLFDRFFFGRMRVKHVRAAVKTAVEKEQRSEQEAFPGGKAHESKSREGKDFLPDPLIKDG